MNTTSKLGAQLPDDHPYVELLKLTRAYFGSDGPNHVAKFLHTHLEKSPNDVTSEDIISLIDWLKILVGFLEDDEEIVKQYIAEVYRRISPGAFGEPEGDQQLSGQ